MSCRGRLDRRGGRRRPLLWCEDGVDVDVDVVRARPRRGIRGADQPVVWV